MTHNIAVLPGDGIGPEIVEQAVRVLKALDVPFDIKQAPVGGAAFDAFEHPLPPATLKLAKESHAVLFGAVGDWKYDSLPREFRPEQAILGLRKALGLFANLRPAILYPELASASSLKPEIVSGLDILIIRELTGDIYFGTPRGAPRLTALSPASARASTPCATPNPKCAASRASASNPPASAARSCAAWTRPTCWRPRSSGATW